jgi:probable F420-dependent oxidoreductase
MGARAARRSSELSVGLHYGATDLSMPIVDVAIAAEERGFDSIFVPEHTHIPTSRTTPYPSGGEIPGRYLRLWDPLVALSFVAARTSLVVGTCVSLPGEHDPIAMAKAVATLDVQSEGRFVMGVGFGWNVEEFEDHGYAGPDRRAVMIEKVRLMKSIWTEDVASFDGKHVHLSPSWSWPKPAQRPHPPVLLGGKPTEITFKRIVDWADGWIPMSMNPLPTLAADLDLLQSMWRAAGRQGEPLVMAMQAPGKGEDLREQLGAFRSIGVDRVLVDVPTAPQDEVLEVLDLVAKAL